MGEKHGQTSYENWKNNLYDPWIQSAPERKTAFHTKSGLPLKPVYTAKNSELPGVFPFTRGITPSMYRSDLWIMGMYSGYGSAEEANKRYRYLIEQGQTGFSIALDLPTQVGYDSDYELSEGEVGKVGVAIDTLEDIERLFEGVPLEKVKQIRTTANAISPLMVALFVAFAEKNNIDPNNIKIFLQNDILKEYLGRGTYILPPGPSVKLASDVIEYCAAKLPAWVPISFSGYHIRDSGSTAVQEVAFSLSNAIAYLDATIARGVSIDEIAPKTFIFLSAGMDLLEEVAKFRAARRVWAKMMKERYSAQKPESMALRIFSYTLGGALTAQQPLNNTVRVTIETLAAVLGGVQTIATSSYDEALGLPSEEAVTVALRTQQIIAEESGITSVADALGGSYVIEALTDEIENRITEKMQEIEEMGGAVHCIGKGILQKEIAETSYEYQKRIEDKTDILVGVNRYKTDGEVEVPVFELDENSEDKQVSRLEKLKSQRNEEAVRLSLEKIRNAELCEMNVIPPMIEAVKNYATVGEIYDVLRNIHGIHRDSAIF